MQVCQLQKCRQPLKLAEGGYRNASCASFSSCTRLSFAAFFSCHPPKNQDSPLESVSTHGRYMELHFQVCCDFEPGMPSPDNPPRIRIRPLRSCPRTVVTWTFICKSVVLLDRAGTKRCVPLGPHTQHHDTEKSRSKNFACARLSFAAFFS